MQAFHQTLFPRPETERQRGDVAEASRTEEKVREAPVRIPGKEGGEGNLSGVWKKAAC